MVIKILAAVVISILEATSALMIFNEMPPKWLLDYGEGPNESGLDEVRAKVKTYPWMYLITGILIGFNIKIISYDLVFFIGATFLIWVLTTLAICDAKCRIIPDQLMILLLVSAIGLGPFLESWTDSLIGGLVGFALVLSTAILGKMIYKSPGAGGGDMKIFAAIGLSVGSTGILAIYIITVLLTVIHYLYLKYYLKVEAAKTVPMVPSIAVATGVFMAFFRETLLTLTI